MRPIKIIVFSLLFLLSSQLSQAQFEKRYKPLNAAELYQSLLRLNTLGSALYIAAHPDDENTRLIAYLTQHDHIRTGYMALTRGDGGQNLIGTEKGEALGILRTYELLGARAIDGGMQFFSRAIDFGYSKTTKETLEIWNKDQVLYDMVWVIRKFRPDVLITRFPPPEKYNFQTHGHHSASAKLAEEAFKAAGDPSRFPEQLKYIDVWQPKRLLWNTSVWFYKYSDYTFDETGKIAVDVGQYDPVLGESYTEIAAESRSMHKSQGFGASKSRGKEIEYLENVMGDEAHQGIFEDIDLGWSRVKGGEKVGEQIQNAIEAFNPADLKATSLYLLKAYDELQKLPDSYWKKIKMDELQKVIAATNGIFFEALTEKPYAAVGSEVKLSAEVIQRGYEPVSLKAIHLPFADPVTPNEVLTSNVLKKYEVNLKIPEDAAFSGPYWLKNQNHPKGMYEVDDPSLIGLPYYDPYQAKFTFSVGGKDIELTTPIQYKWTDPAKGELYRPFDVTPPATANIAGNVFVFPDQQSKKISIRLRSFKDNAEGKARLNLPDGWTYAPAEINFSLDKNGEEKEITFEVTPPKKQASSTMEVALDIEGKTYAKSFQKIDHEHIPLQTYFPPATAQVVKLDIKTAGHKIGYIMGPGDEIPECLRQIGYDVIMLNKDNFKDYKLADFDAVISGIRAYNTEDWLKFRQDDLMNYVKEGGTYIVQYCKNRNLVTEPLGPYPFEISHDRVTDENAEMKMIAPHHAILNEPNKITAEDFQGWVQERGLYFADKWQEEYIPVFSSHDPGEDPLEGSLLFAQYGAGAFMYTGLSFFRQLPAGVPGAYRLLANMISYGKTKRSERN